MKWDKFIELNDVGKKYQLADFESDTLMDPEIRNLGIAWAQKPSKSLVLFGDTGRGKTHFMYALIRKIVEKYSLACVRFFKSKKLDDRLLEEFKKHGTNSYFIEIVIEVSVLLIDDFGIERPTERSSRDMYEIIDGRLEHQRPTVISTNLSDSDIEEIYGKRILSRLKEYVWLNFEGDDLRGKI